MKEHHPSETPQVQKETEPETIAALITGFRCENGLERQHARHKLVQIGSPAIPELIMALSDPTECVRWEAAKALGQIKDPAAAAALVKAMDDDSFGVRWLAAEGVVKLGKPGLASLLEMLKKHADSRQLREGAHHVLRMLNERGFHDTIAPVLQALEGVEPVVEVPLAAQAVLDSLESNSSPTD